MITFTLMFRKRPAPSFLRRQLLFSKFGLPLTVRRLRTPPPRVHLFCCIFVPRLLQGDACGGGEIDDDDDDANHYS